MQLTAPRRSCSVERVAEYCRLETEPAGGAPPLGGAAWPRDGRIDLCNVEMRYRPFARPALRALTLSVAPRSKTALCGRTGCGKSSLFGALCRLYPVCAGQILIDGVDLASLPLVVVRRVVVVITQDVLLLEGTLLSNLVVRAEPGAAADDDAAAWAALERVGLSARVPACPAGCARPRAGDFSEGEASCPRPRAPPRRPNTVLLCDEPTRRSAADARARRALDSTRRSS